MTMVFPDASHVVVDVTDETEHDELLGRHRWRVWARPSRCRWAMSTFGPRRSRSSAPSTSAASNRTKTYDCRTVDLTPDLLRILHDHVLRLKEEALRRGWGEPVWLFPNQTGPNLQIVAQAIEKFGEPCGTRTHDPLIKRSLHDYLGEDPDLTE
jgi:hypothetical protein